MDSKHTPGYANNDDRNEENVFEFFLTPTFRYLYSDFAEQSLSHYQVQQIWQLGILPSSPETLPSNICNILKRNSVLTANFKSQNTYKFLTTPASQRIKCEQGPRDIQKQRTRNAHFETRLTHSNII